MKRFRYTGFSADGKRDSSVVEFATEVQAWESLTGLGLTIVELVPVDRDVARSNMFASLFSKTIPLSSQADVAEQLSVLFGAKLQATEIVDVVAQGAETIAIKQCFEKMGRLLADGATFSGAFEQAGTGFSPLFHAMLRVSQSTSNPVMVLQKLGLHLRRQQKLQAQLSGALVYPIILLFGGIGVFLLVVFYLAPSLAPMFVSQSREVPAAIGVFLTIGRAVTDYGVQILLGLICIIGTGLLFATRIASFLRRVVLKLPVVGPILRDTALARLTRSLNMMLESDIPLAQALRDTATNLNQDVFAPLFAEASEVVETGSFGAPIFAQNGKIPVVFKELFKIGERTNSLTTITGSLATALEDRVERQAQQAVVLITPLLTLIMGGAIALLVYSIMDAILSINDLAF